MEDKEKATPVTPDEIEDIRVTLDLDEGEVECKILTIFEVNKQDYIALMPLNPDGSDPDEGTVYLYRYAEDEDGIPQLFPLGRFTGKGDAMEGDYEREQTPKILLAGAYSYNDRALRAQGSNGDKLLFDQTRMDGAGIHRNTPRNGSL